MYRLCTFYDLLISGLKQTFTLNPEFSRCHFKLSVYKNGGYKKMNLNFGNEYNPSLRFQGVSFG